MQDTELHGRAGGYNDRLVSERAVSRRQSRSLYRHWVAASRKLAYQSQTNVMTRISTSSIGNEADIITESSCSLIEDRADEIVRHIEQSQSLMDENPKFNIDSIETLRVMTEYLTLKRSVKKKLTISIPPNTKALSFSKRLRYRMSIFCCKIPVIIKNFIGNFELWYSSLKVIEGHFGSSVASYFKFLRKLFLLNACIFILISFFVLIPQLLFRFIQFVDDGENALDEDNGTSSFSVSFNPVASPVVMVRNDPYRENEEFRLGNIFTGEGFLTNTILFYGYYTNTSLKLVEGYTFNIPASYFFTSAVCYFIIFFFLFTSVAVTYRKCYIETSGGMNNTFSNKILCGWDFSIANRQAADLKSKSIYIEVKELLDEVSRSKRKKSCAYTFYTTAISFSLNGILLFLLGIGGMYSWKYLDQQMTKADTATTMMMWLILTLVIAVAPVLFSLITNIEGFESQSSALYMTLIRTFTLYAVVVAVVVAYRLNRSTESECWETVLGQDMYRLVLLDFIFGLMGTALSEFIRYRIYVKMWEGIGCPEFDIARGTMNLIYNQTLFYIGLYFSPVLSLIITVKMFLTFYIRKWGAIYNCKPFLKPWRASQAHTVYLSIAFLSFFSVVIAYGYIITSYVDKNFKESSCSVPIKNLNMSLKVKTSNCGPFRGEKFIYLSVLNDILANKDSFILTIFYYITRPGVVGIALMALVLGVYYMRAVALARIHVVNHLRHLLLLKAEDRKLLLNEIAKYTKAQQPHGNDKHPHTEEGLTSFNTDPKERSRGHRENFEVMKKSKFCPVSLSNLSTEPDTKNTVLRSKIFNSVQNLNGSFLDGRVNPRVQIRKASSYEDGVFEMVQWNATSDAKWEDDLTKDELRYQPTDETDKGNGSLALVEEEIISRPPLNFNPVFTESFQIDESAEENSGVGSSYQNKRVPDATEESILRSDDLDDSGNDFINYVRFQERVPSRISFDSRSSKSSRKKKRN
ncbi:hypothetical protein RUM43_004459 [Polyplax serrata]|uniref:TMC domain-containing protein n=1 Tax=Polyplax serrata TaxID=468196 RepID=A0AAN8XPX1_POLSC